QTCALPILSKGTGEKHRSGTEDNSLLLVLCLQLLEYSTVTLLYRYDIFLFLLFQSISIITLWFCPLRSVCLVERYDDIRNLKSFLPPSPSLCNPPPPPFPFPPFPSLPSLPLSPSFSSSFFPNIPSII